MADGTSSGSMGGSERESGINGFSFFLFLFHVYLQGVNFMQKEDKLMVIV